jgi:hypothetical protein
MITLEQLVTSLQSHVASELPEEVPLVLPGIVLDAETTPEWIEFSWDAVSGVVQRESPAEVRDVSVTLQVFVRASKQTARVQALAEIARGVFSGRTIEVIDYTDSAEPVVGAVRFREADVRDLTRVHAAHQRRALRQVVVTVNGTAQAYVG